MTIFEHKRGTIVAVDRGRVARLCKVAVVLGPSRAGAGRPRIALWSHHRGGWSKPYAARPGEILGNATYGRGERFAKLAEAASRAIQKFGMPDERGAA